MSPGVAPGPRRKGEMKIRLIIAVMALLASTAFAGVEKASLNGTGYEWLGYDKEEKAAFTGLFYAVYGADRNKNRPADIIKTLDDFYYGAIKKAQADPLRVDEDDFLKVRCVDVLTKDPGGSAARK